MPPPWFKEKLCIFHSAIVAPPRCPLVSHSLKRAPRRPYPPFFSIHLTIHNPIIPSNHTHNSTRITQNPPCMLPPPTPLTPLTNPLTSTHSLPNHPPQCPTPQKAPRLPPHHLKTRQPWTPHWPVPSAAAASAPAPAPPPPCLPPRHSKTAPGNSSSPTTSAPCTCTTGSPWCFATRAKTRRRRRRPLARVVTLALQLLLCGGRRRRRSHRRCVGMSGRVIFAGASVCARGWFLRMGVEGCVCVCV